MTPQLLCVILLLIIDNVASVNNIIYPNCNTDNDCQIGEAKVFLKSRPDKLPKAECGPNKKCLNPYRNGCLRTLKGKPPNLEGEFGRKINKQFKEVGIKASAKKKRKKDAENPEMKKTLKI